MKNIIRKLKLLAKVALGKELLIQPDLIFEKERFGKDYGAWDLVVTGLNADSVVYSFGVGEDASFDIALIEKFSLIVHAFDPTPKSIEWVKRQRFSKKFVMHHYGIATFDGNVFFNPPENPEHVSHTIIEKSSTKGKAISVPVKKISTIMQELGHNKIHVLKMDIEGAEYDVIDDIEKSDIRPDQILIEFHHRFPGIGVKKTRQAINKIKSMGYQLYSVSDTNEEYCFIQSTKK